MTEKQRAERAREALDAIEQALASLEDAQYAGPDDVEDDLWWAIERFITEHHEAVDRKRWTLDGAEIEAPERALWAAIRKRLG